MLAEIEAKLSRDASTTTPVTLSRMKVPTEANEMVAVTATAESGTAVGVAEEQSIAAGGLDRDAGEQLGGMHAPDSPTACTRASADRSGSSARAPRPGSPLNRAFIEAVPRQHKLDRLK